MRSRQRGSSVASQQTDPLPLEPPCAHIVFEAQIHRISTHIHIGRHITKILRNKPQPMPPHLSEWECGQRHSSDTDRPDLPPPTCA